MRLNPFAFPTTTQLRFWLISVLLATTAFSLGTSTYWVRHPIAVAETIQSILDKPWDQRNLSAIGLMQTGDVRSRLGESYKWGLLSLTASLLFSVIFYHKFLPWWTRRKYCYTLPFDNTVAPDIFARIELLSKRAGIATLPALVWNPLDHSDQARMFGTASRPFLGIGLGLLVAHGQRPSVFDAIVLHELAHLKNGDLPKTCKMVAMCCSTLVTVAAWAVANILSPHDQPYARSQFYSNIIELAITSTAVGLSYLSFLRTRELYADLRASTWESSVGGLLQRLSSTPESRGFSSWNLLRSHPSSQARCRSIKDPDTLLRLSFWDAFMAGIVAGFSADTLQSVARWALAEFVAGLALAPPTAVALVNIAPALIVLGVFCALVGTVGIGVWWRTFRGVMRQYKPSGAGLLGAGAVLGFFSVFLLQVVPLVPLVLAQTRGNYLPLAAGTLPVVGVAVAFLCGIVAISFKWIETCAAGWIRARLESEFPKTALLLSLVGCGMLTALFLIILFVTMTLMLLRAKMVEPVPVGSTLWICFQIGSWPLFVMAPLFWLLPLLPRFMPSSNRTPNTFSWALLEPQLGSMPIRNSPRPQIKWAIVSGLLGGALFCMIHWSIPHVLWINRQFLSVMRLFHVTGSQIGAVVLLVLPALTQVSAAMFTAWWVKHLNTLLGFLAAYVAACVGAVWVYFTSDGGSPTSEAFVSVFISANVGVAVSVLCAYVVSCVKSSNAHVERALDARESVG